MIFKWIAKLFVALNANTRPSQIAAGVAFAFMIALLPAGNLFALFILVVTFFLNTNNAVMLVSIPLFGLVTPLFDPLCEQIGYFVLRLPQLTGLFTMLYNFPVFPFSAFNDSLVLGALMLGILLFVPVLALFVLLVNLYRVHVRDRIARTKFMKSFTKLPVIAQLAKAIAGAQGMYVG